MWFRIELDKSGAILSCDLASESLKSGRLIRYVEAESKEKACGDVLAWYEKYRQGRREFVKKFRQKRVDAGCCVQCGKKMPEERRGKYSCVACIKKQSASKRRRNARIESGDTTDLRAHPGGPEAVQMNVRQGAHLGMKMLVDRAGGAQAYRFWLILQRYDSMSSRDFRAWLVSKIPNYEKLMQEKLSGASTQNEHDQAAE